MSPEFHRRIDNPDELAAAGERLYSKKFQKKYEKEFPGKFVAIDVNAGEAYIGDTSLMALELARQAAPEGLFHLIRVGSPSAFHVSRINAPMVRIS